MKTKLRSIGNSVGVILPTSLLGHLGVDRGDVVFLSATESGVGITAYDEDFAEEIELAEDIMKRYRNALRLLA